MTTNGKHAKVSFPYIEEMLEYWDAKAPEQRDNFSEDLHFGFWSDPGTAASSRSLPEFKRAMEALNDKVTRLAQVQSGSRVIDIGCGFGGAVHRLNQTLENATLVGLNIDERQIDVARAFCGNGIRGNQISFTVADAQ